MFELPVFPVVLGSCATFMVLAHSLKKAALPRCLKNPAQKSAWLWRNTFCSLIHSCVSAAWTLFW